MAKVTRSRVTAKAMREALENIAGYPLPVFTAKYEEREMQMVPVENADYLRTMAKEVLHPEET